MRNTQVKSLMVSRRNKDDLDEIPPVKSFIKQFWETRMKDENMKTGQFLPKITGSIKDIKFKENEFPPGLIEKKRLQVNEEVYAVAQKIHRKMHTIVNINDCHNPNANLQITTNLLRNYNPGRHGKWNNYASCKGNAKSSYVKTRNTVGTAEFG